MSSGSGKGKGKGLDRRTKIVQELQIVGQRPVTAEIAEAEELKPQRRKPPVRELARTGLYQPILHGAPPKLPADDAPVESDATRVVRDLTEPSRAQFVDLCPTALFQLDAEARVQWANEPFAEFARKTAQDLAGERIDRTRLGVIYPSVFEDITRCLAEERPPTLRQTLRYQLQDGREQARGCWIVPALGADGRVVRLFGYLMPFED